MQSHTRDEEISNPFLHRGCQTVSLDILISEETQIPFNDNLTNDASDLFESNMEVYKMKVPVDWNGWEIKSFRYSDFEPVSPNNPAIDFNMNPKDISAIRISCQACPSSPGNPICPENFGKIVRTIVVNLLDPLNTHMFLQDMHIKLNLHN